MTVTVLLTKYSELSGVTLTTENNGFQSNITSSEIIIIIIIITSNDDPKPSTVISDQSPSG